MESSTEATLFFTPTNNFELTIYLTSDHGVWSDRHHLPQRPETDTIKALLGVAMETFIALYDEEPETYSCGLEYLVEEEETETQPEVP
jgi:hypothetical protein